MKNAIVLLGVPLPETGETVAVTTTGPLDPATMFERERFTLVEEAVTPLSPADKLKNVPPLFAPPCVVVP